MQPAGFEIFDVADPGKPRSIAFFDASGPALARRAPPVVRRRRLRPPEPAARRDFKPRNPKDDQCYRIVDVRAAHAAGRGRALVAARHARRRRRAAAGRGTRSSTPASAPTTRTSTRAGPDRAWIGYIDGGAIVLDISDMARPRLVSRWDYHPPFPGFTHTLLPLFDRELLIVSDEATADGGRTGRSSCGSSTSRDETNPVPIATCPAAARGRVRRTRRTLRRPQPAREPAGAGVWSRRRSSSAPSSTAACAPSTSRTRSGPRRSRTTCRQAPRGSRAGAAQINDVFVDERGVVYAVDRLIGGLYMLERSRGDSSPVPDRMPGSRGSGSQTPGPRRSGAPGPHRATRRHGGQRSRVTLDTRPARRRRSGTRRRAW